MRIAVARLVAAAFWTTTAWYALLAAIPFVAKQFLEPQLVPAATAFARWHGWISLVALAATGAALSPRLRAGDRRVAALLALWGATIAGSFAGYGLTPLGPSAASLGACLAALGFAAWLAVLDLREVAAPALPPPAATSPLTDFIACGAAAVIVSLVHVLGATMDGASTEQMAQAASLAAYRHLIVFLAAFAAISVLRGAASLFPASGPIEAWLGRGAVAAVLALFTYSVVLSSVSFTGATAAGMAVAIGTALALVVAPRGTHTPVNLEAAFVGLVPRWTDGSLTRMALWMLMVLFAVAAGQAAIGGSDWNFTVGKLLALVSWLMTLAAALRVVPALTVGLVSPRPAAWATPFVACLLLLALQHLGVAATHARDNGRAWSGDVSSRLIVDALTPAAPADAGLYEYLQRNTNIAHSIRVEPVSIDFAAVNAPSAKRPHIFLFVVDSLRRDYLSPYNAAVDFTPSIARFAADSTVFERAFTRYGGTGLAVPSIWVGGQLLHKQYVTPFAPMNTLAKLLTGERYVQSLSMEEIVATITPAIGMREPLDVGVPVKNHRMCDTLGEVRSRLGRIAAGADPAFVYSLPQDIHVSTIARDNVPVDDGEYVGFSPQYASRVRRLDACFGEFIEDLKTHGLYEQSIVILTSDHGDSLGEEGRRGHAYTIFPEVIQVPLLVHLPASLRAEYVADPQALAFTSDITPSLYALLGHPPVRPSNLFGLPLFRAAGSEPPPRADVEVVASSYGSIYGALLDDARRLYIIDAVSLQEHAYRLDGTAAGRAEAVSSLDREAGQRAVRRTIAEIARFYGHPAD